MALRSARKRGLLRDALSPGMEAKVWPQPKEAGWAKVPRVLCVLLAVVRDNTEKGLDPAGAYLDLLTRNMGEGLVEITSEQEHATLSGLSGTTRGIRSWRERVRALQELGLLQVFPTQGPRIDHVIVLHPKAVMTKLHAEGKVSDELWLIFRRMLIDYSSESELENEAQAAPPVPASLPSEAAP